MRKWCAPDGVISMMLGFVPSVSVPSCRITLSPSTFMSVASQSYHLISADELQSLDIPEKGVELVRGRLIISEPPGLPHSRLGASMTYLLSDYVRRNRLGTVYAGDPGFHLASDPDTVRGPDIAFVTAARVHRQPTNGFGKFAPDLIVQVWSPSNRRGEMLGRIADFLDAGTRLVW